MHDNSVFFIAVGSILLLGLATDYLGRKSFLPRVTLLFVFGFVIGAGGLGLLPEESQGWLSIIANMALMLVGFILGGRLTKKQLRENGQLVICTSISIVLGTVIVVSIGLVLLGVPIAIALLLAGIATATAPAATLDVITESHAQGPFTNALQGIVAVDDVWGLVVFSVLLALVEQLSGAGSPLQTISTALYEIVGAIVLGVLLGIPMAWISGRIKPGEPTMIEALGMVMLCGGLALWLGVSYLLSSMVLGIVVANLAKHHERPFHEIEDIESPFMILFFVLTGASLHVEMIETAGWLTAAYVLLRVLGRIVGAIPARWFKGKDDRLASQWLGVALLPQAGVAIGMALLVSAQLPSLAETIVPVVILATILFELIGPVCTKWSLGKAGDIPDSAETKVI